jgi:hypothetical protein
VVEPGGAAGLTERTVAEFVLLVVGQPVRRDELLDGDVAVEHFVAGHPDPAHASGADRLEETIPTGDEHQPDRHPPPFRSTTRIVSTGGPAKRRSPGHCVDHEVVLV